MVGHLGAEACCFYFLNRREPGERAPERETVASAGDSSPSIRFSISGLKQHLYSGSRSTRAGIQLASILMEIFVKARASFAVQK